MSDLIYHINPFPGIRNFEPEEDFLFFGRDEQIKNMLGILSEKHFLALIGYSGSGKSSLIKAGIIPAISKGEMNKGGENGWETIYFRPEDDPFRSFAAALHKIFGIGDEDEDEFIKETVAFLKQDKTDFNAIYQKFNTIKNKNWLVFIDQFEELFRFRSSVYTDTQLKEAQQFVRIILSVLNKKKLPVYLAITMRSDFIDSCTEFPDFPEALNEVFYLLPKFSVASLKEAIVKPILVCGGQITDRLVERLITDADDKSEHLPVLQHALMRTWDYWKLNKVGDEPIDIQHYEAIGGMAMALSIHAEEIYKGVSSAKGRQITETIFKALNNLGKDNKGTRRPVPLKDLILLTQASEDEVVDVIDQFRGQGRAFLLPYYTVPITPDSIIDIAHESIMRLWVRLKNWIEEETRSAELYLRLSESAKLYQQGKTGLWIDTDLALAIKWQQDNNPNSLWASRYDPAFERAITFLDYSKKESVAKIEQKAKKQARELKSAKRTAVVLGTASIVAILLLVFALNLKFKADASAKIALEKDKKSRLAGIEADERKKEAVLQERIAEQQKDIAAQQQSIAEDQRHNAILEKQDALNQKIIADNQKKIAIDSGLEAKRQRSLALTQESIAKKATVAASDSGKAAAKQRDLAIKAGHDIDTLRMLSEAKAIAFKSNQLISDAQKDTLSMQMAFLSYAINNEYGGSSQNRAIYDALKAQLNHYYNKALTTNYGVKTNPGNYDFRTVAFLRNNDFFTGGDDGLIKEWTVSKGPLQINNVKTSKTIAESIYNICLSPDKKSILGRLANGKIAIWDAGDISLPAHILNDPSIGTLQYATFLPVQGNNCILLKSSKFAYIYTITKTDFKLQNRYALCNVTGDNASPAGCYQPKKDGFTVFLAEGGSICALNFDSHADLTAQNIVVKLDQKISSMGISANGNTLAIGTEAGSVELYSISGAKPVFQNRVSSHSSRVTGLSFTQNEGLLASGSFDNSIKVEDLKNRKNTKTEDLIFQERKGWIRDIVMSPDNRYVLAVGQSGVMQFWPLTEFIVLQELTSFTANKKLITGNLNEREIENAISTDVYKRLWVGKYKSFKDFWNAMANKYITKSV